MRGAMRDLAGGHVRERLDQAYRAGGVALPRLRGGVGAARVQQAVRRYAAPAISARHFRQVASDWRLQCMVPAALSPQADLPNQVRWGIG